MYFWTDLVKLLRLYILTLVPLTIVSVLIELAFGHTAGWYSVIILGLLGGCYIAYKTTWRQ